jgi:5-methylcytosine-specific restriction endonuclease McrA
MQDKLMAIYDRDNYTCQRCQQPASQIAHRIAKTKSNINMLIKFWGVDKKEAEKIIHHELNLVAVCGLKCNDSYNIGFNRIATDKLIKEILEDLK